MKCLDLPVLSKDKVEKTVKTFENRNGSKLSDFSIKEIILMFHKQLAERCESIEKKMDKHLKWSIKNKEEGYKHLAECQKEHDELLNRVTNTLDHIAETLPEKGFCEKVTNELKLDKNTTLADQVETLWHDRRWLKAIFAALLATTGGIVINIIIQVT